jgi:hypothetical protein
MPPIVLKVGSAFIGNAFGRSLNAQTATRDGHGRLDPARRPYVSGLGKRTKRVGYGAMVAIWAVLHFTFSK